MPNASTHIIRPVIPIQARFGTIAGAAAYASLSTKSIQRLIARQELTAYRPLKGRVLVDLRQLDAVVRGSAGQSSTRGGLREVDA